MPRKPQTKPSSDSGCLLGTSSKLSFVDLLADLNPNANPDVIEALATTLNEFLLRRRKKFVTCLWKVLSDDFSHEDEQNLLVSIRRCGYHGKFIAGTWWRPTKTLAPDNEQKSPWRIKHRHLCVAKLEEDLKSDAPFPSAFACDSSSLPSVVKCSLCEDEIAPGNEIPCQSLEARCSPNTAYHAECLAQTRCSKCPEVIWPCCLPLQTMAEFRCIKCSSLICHRHRSHYSHMLVPVRTEEAGEDSHFCMDGCDSSPN